MSSELQPLSAKLIGQMQAGSWIRRMFEEGAKLRVRHGAENVHDFSLGNPILEPPPAYLEALQRCVTDAARGTHRYMSNVGLLAAREAVAKHVARVQGVHAVAANVIMSIGAAGAINIALKAVLDAGDEVVLLTPYFPEYVYYVDNHRAVARIVDTADDFEPDVERIAAVLNERTRVVIINSPNNPSGRLYREGTLRALGEALAAASRKFGRVIWLLSDEPYVRLIYDATTPPPVFQMYPDTVICTSYSKDLSLPGERIGYACVNPRSAHTEPLINAMAFSNRVLGYINAPALQQRAIAQCLDASVDIGWYRQRRDRMFEVVTAAGFDCVKPEGAFYLFPRVPPGINDVDFVTRMRDNLVLVVPGSGFGRPGYFRVSYAVEMPTIERAAPIFARVGREFGLR